MGAGRPVKASQTLDEALSRYYSGQLPLRPRNAIEREVMQQRRGPKAKPNSPTQNAAQLAVVLVRDGLSMREAARTAAGVYGVKPDSVRKPARKLLLGLRVQVRLKVDRHLAWLVPDTLVTVPLLVKVSPNFEDLP